MRKSDQSKLVWGLLFGLIIVGLFGNQIGNYLNMPAGSVTQQPVTQQTPVQKQAGVQRTLTVDTTTFGLHPYDAFSPGATIDIEGVVMSKNNDVKFDSDNLANETVSLQPLGTYTIYMWNDGQTTDLSGSSITLSSTEYYGYQETITLPFAGEATFPGSFKTTYKGNYKESAPSVYVKNPDGTVNSSSNQADLSAGQVKTFIFHYDAPNNAAYGAPQAKDFGANMKFACDYNVTAYDSIELTSAIYDGKSYKVKEASDYPDYNTSVFDWVGEIEGLSGIVDNKALELGVTVTVAQSVTLDDTGADFTCYLLDPELWYDSTNGTGFHWGVDNSAANTDVGLANTYKKVYVN